MKYTKESFYNELKRRFPNNEFQILEFSGTFKPIKYQCLTCGRIIEKNRANHLYENKTLCQHCYSTRNSKIRNWIINFFNTNSQFQLISWSENTMDSILMQCKKCNRSFLKKPNNLYLRQENTICPYCGDNGAPILLEDFKKEMLKNGYNDYTILKYTTIGKSVKFQHSCGYVFSQIGHNFLKSRGCPKCFNKKSKGELKIEQWLKENNINYVYQYIIKEINNYSYDFYLPNYNTLIEYQGQQHYYPIDYFGGEQKFYQQLQHDQIKKDYAQKQKYNLIIIPYTDYDKITSYLLPILGSTTIPCKEVASSEAKEKTFLNDNIV